jgi:8-oxo-dGTP pyrophosphatase MutT (NUDIX family)
LPWPLLSRAALADFRVFRVRRDVARSPRTGRAHDFYVLEGPDWINVVALTADGRMLFVRQFRHGTQAETLELPGGCTEASDASPLASARRELLEETGYVSESWTLLGVVDPNPAIQTNACHTFLALDARKVAEPAPDGAEDLLVELLAPAEVTRLVGAGEIRHALTVAALHWYHLAGPL